jgi:hypothetical protein
MTQLGIQIGYINLGIKEWLWADKSTDGKWALRFVCHGNDILRVAKMTKAVRLEADGGTICHAKINLIYETWEDLIGDLEQFLDLKLVELIPPETVFKARRPERARLLARVALDTQQLAPPLRAELLAVLLRET